MGAEPQGERGVSRLGRSVPDFAGALDVSERTDWREIAAKRLGFIRIRGCVVIPEEEIRRYLAERFTPPSANTRKDASQASARIAAAVRRYRAPGTGGRGL